VFLDDGKDIPVTKPYTTEAYKECGDTGQGMVNLSTSLLQILAALSLGRETLILV
jgi:hypothetical protein